MWICIDYFSTHYLLVGQYFTQYLLPNMLEVRSGVRKWFDFLLLFLGGWRSRADGRRQFASIHGSFKEISRVSIIMIKQTRVIDKEFGYKKKAVSCPSTSLPGPNANGWTKVCETHQKRVALWSYETVIGIYTLVLFSSSFVLFIFVFIYLLMR